ncbi:MAG TPA: 2-phospho-L-lactate transferase CofD family protein, partial [Candidatus Angelobacter sp.]|nr:2-phospho-L-lactate transferase CofD family protein [Candidatus Angelobacter sp.]
MLSNSEHSQGGGIRPVRVVAIGGGTGLSTLLKGLKRYTFTGTKTPSRSPHISDLTAVVTVSDDGGSSGRLRRE